MKDRAGDKPSVAIDIPTPEIWIKSRTTNPSLGFTLIEVVIVVAIMGTLAGIGVPLLADRIEKAKIERAAAEIRMLEKSISLYLMDNNAYPDSLSDIGKGNLLDPWDHPYQYLRIDGGTANQGQMRKDRFLVPVNNDYDLYSMGKDGESQSPFNSAKSRDDVVRATNGAYVGLASEF